MRIDLLRPAAGQRKWLQSMAGPGMPLGLAYIAAAAERAGHAVRMVDAVTLGGDVWQAYGPIVARGLPNEELVSHLDPAVEVVGISCMFTVDWLNALDLCRRVKALRPDAFVVLGGEHASALPEVCLRTSPADCVVVGEGEETFVELLDALAGRRPLDGVLGIAFRNGPTIQVNPRRARIAQANTIARPAWHLVDVAAYHRLGIVGSGYYTGQPTVPILASRGCPYACTYCSAASMWDFWKERDPVEVVDEIQHYVETFGAGNFPFYDLTTIIKRSWVERLCREIIDRKLHIHWQLGVGTRIEQLDRDLARLLRESGLFYLAFAPESGSELTRERVKKKLKQSDLERATDAALAEGLRVEYMLVLGFPHETHAELRETLGLAWWAGRKGVHDVGPGVFTPIPGTELFDELISSRRIQFDQDLLFATITNFGFLPKYVTSDHVSRASVVAYMYAVTAAFYASRTLHHGPRMMGELFDTARKDEDSGMLGKLLAGTAGAVRRELTRGRRHVRLAETDLLSIPRELLLRGPPPPRRATSTVQADAT